jgi:hypothetical protein
LIRVAFNGAESSLKHYARWIMITHWKPEFLTRKLKLGVLQANLKEKLKSAKYELRIDKGHNMKHTESILKTGWCWPEGSGDPDYPMRPPYARESVVDVQWLLRRISWFTARVAKLERLVPRIDALVAAEETPEEVPSPRPKLRLVTALH